MFLYLRWSKFSLAFFQSSFYSELLQQNYSQQTFICSPTPRYAFWESIFNLASPCLPPSISIHEDSWLLVVPLQGLHMHPLAWSPLPHIARLAHFFHSNLLKRWPEACLPHNPVYNSSFHTHTPFIFHIENTQIRANEEYKEIIVFSCQITNDKDNYIIENSLSGVRKTIL